MTEYVLVVLCLCLDVWLKCFDVMFLAQPSFVVTPTDKTVGIGRRATFRCEVTGSPLPTVFWNKEASQVSVKVLLPVNSRLDFAGI